LKIIVSLPKVERETIRQTPNETYRVTGTPLNRVIIRLDNYNEWMQTEREFRPSRSEGTKP